MLPLMMLQATDVATFATEPNSAELLPQDALEPTVTFADVLQAGLQPPAQPDGLSGTLLPVPGNGLPSVGPQVADSALFVAAASQPRGEAVPIEFPPLPGEPAPQAMPSVEARLPATPAAPVAPANGLPATQEAPIVLARQPLPADGPQGQPLTELATARRDTGAEPPGPVVAARPQPVQGGALSRFASTTSAPTAQVGASPEQVQTALGRQGTASTIPGMPAGTARGSEAAAPLAAADTLRESVAREFRQPLPAAQPGGDSLNQFELPTAQGQQNAQGLQTAQSPQLTSPQLASGLSQAAGSATTAAAPQAQAPIDVPVRDAAWSNQLGERVVVMANNQLQNAEIRLTPAELGPLRVQVAVEDGAANVTFLAQHAVTREAIEQALPRLRELLAENGLTLNQADVGEQAGPGVHQGNREAGGDGLVEDGSVAALEEDTTAEAASATERPRQRADSLVDTFA